MYGNRLGAAHSIKCKYKVTRLRVSVCFIDIILCRLISLSCCCSSSSSKVILFRFDVLVELCTLLNFVTFVMISIMVQGFVGN